MKKQQIFILTLSMSGILGAEAATSKPHSLGFDSFLVRWKQAPPPGKQSLLQRLGAKKLETNGEWYRIDAKKSSLLKTLSSHLIVEPNWKIRIHPQTVKNSEALPWGIQKIHAESYWQRFGQGDSSVTVGIVDTGMDSDHPDLHNHALSGYNAITDDSNTFDDNTHGHGTHVAGTIGAHGKILGVAPQVRLWPGKFLDAEGSGELGNAIKVIDRATDLGIPVLSNSWGADFYSYSTALKESIARYCESGGVFVAAAGNGGWDGIGDSNDWTPNYPASYKLPCVISVAASDDQDAFASFSNYGRSVHLSAPGVGVYSTLPGGNYGTLSGTSMATPHVSGAVALLLSRDPSLSAAEILVMLQKATQPISWSWSDKLFGKGLASGRLDLSAFANE